MLHLENKYQQRKEGRKQRKWWDLHDISELGRCPQDTQVKDHKDCKKQTKKKDCNKEKKSN